MQKTLGRAVDRLLSRALPSAVASAEVCSPATWCHSTGCTNGVAWRIDAYRQPNCDVTYVHRTLGRC